MARKRKLQTRGYTLDMAIGDIGRLYDQYCRQGKKIVLAALERKRDELEGRAHG